MEGPSAGLRSRSRSRTPSVDVDNARKSGRKTPLGRNTPVKQLSSLIERSTPEPISEEMYTSPPAHRTRSAVTQLTVDNLQSKEQFQNVVNSHYEHSRTRTTRHGYDTAGFSDHLSPSKHSSPYVPQYASPLHRSFSPAHSACSTDSSFAEQALADVSRVIELDTRRDHLPYRLYKMAGEYWNKYPKTDYTYSPLSRDRVELAPGQVAVPNMSRRSLAHYRAVGDVTNAVELERLLRQHNAWTERSYESSEEECLKKRTNGAYSAYSEVRSERWWVTRVMLAVYTTLTTAVSSAYSRVRGRDVYAARYRSQQKPGVASRAASALAAPFVWLYCFTKTVVTTTTTTVTNTIWGSEQTDGPYYTRGEVKRRRWWPWLLLLPLIFYGCYTRPELLNAVVRESRPLQEGSTAEHFVAPHVHSDPDLSKRLLAVEQWIGAVDKRLQHFDQRLAKIDNLEAQMESISLKHLQQNLVQIFNVNGKDGKITSDELKSWFDQHYASKSELRDAAKGIENKMADRESGVDEEAIRRIIEEYMATHESKQVVLLKETIRHYVREATAGGCGDACAGDWDEARVRKLVAVMLDVYDADKTGLVDYAMESAGGQVISTRCTELYQIKTKQYWLLGVPVFWVYTSPRHALTPGAMPAECWAFQGFPGYLVVRTYATIEVTGFSIEHMSRLLAADGKIESAPKNFSVYGLRDENDLEPHQFGTYMYDATGPSIQHFAVQRQLTVDIGGRQYPVAHDLVELRVESNHGNPVYTCLYRFRVHGNPLSDVRKATEDNMGDEL